MRLTHKVHPFIPGALRRRTLVLFIAVLFLSSTLLQQAEAAAFGKLDRSFGGGRVEPRFSRDREYGEDVAIQADGRIVVAASVGGGLSGGSDFGLARYDADGSLDASFGHSGKVLTSINLFDSLMAMAIQTDGRIVVSGSTSTSPAAASLDMALARYNIDGSLDTSFGVGGKVTTDFFGDQDWASAIGIRPDGRIVVAGAADDSNSNQGFAVAQYNTDGSLDTNFGVGGKATTRFPGLGGSGGGFAHGLAIQSDGSIVVVGTAVNISDDFALVRFLSYGSLDTSFGMGGKVVTDFFNNYDSASSIAIQSDGRLVVGGCAVTVSDPLNSFDFALARYNTNGSLDSTFGTGGKVTTDLRGYSDQGGDLAIQPDGGIVLAGGSSLTSDYLSSFDFALTRYHTDGSLDSAFGISGIAITDFHGFNDSANSIAIQQDGRIVAAGNSYVSSTVKSVALARYR